MKCPDCEGELKTDQKLGQGVWRCTKCGWSWFILKLRKRGGNLTVEKVPYLDIFTLKDLLTEAVYYLQVRCDVPEDLVRRVNKEIGKEVEINMGEVVRKTGEFEVKSEDGKTFEVIEYTRHSTTKPESEGQKELWTSKKDPVRLVEDKTYEILTESGLIKVTSI